MAKHWTQTPEGRKRMGKISKARHAAKAAVTATFPLDAIPERPTRKVRRPRNAAEKEAHRDLVALPLHLKIRLLQFILDN